MTLREHQQIDDLYVSDMTTIDVCLQSGLLDTAAAGIDFVSRWVERNKIAADHPIRAQLFMYRQQLDEKRADPMHALLR